MKRPALRALSAGLLLLALAWTAARAGELFPPAPIGEVSVRLLPAFTVIETDTTGSLQTAWTKGFRIGARYAASTSSGLNTPTLIIFPDWDKNPTAEGDKLHLLVQCLLDPLPNLPKTNEPGASLEQVPAVTVACCAHSGAYTPANFALCLKKIEDHLRAKHLAAVGPPRYLYYSNTTSWSPSWWRVGEVQVPIAAGGKN